MSGPDTAARPASAAEVAKLHGADDDTSRSLDAGRDWLKVTCRACDEEGVVARPAKGTNVVMEPATVTASLPDGSKVPFATTIAVPAPTLRWECSHCDTVQEVTL